MSILNTGISALGKLFALGVLVAAFGAGLVTVVYMSLQGKEIKVPEIIGKDFGESEKELASLGLKIKKRADRVSAETPNTVIEQLPKVGETVKTGQMIYVVISKGGGTEPADQKPPTLKSNGDEDDSATIEEMISDKPVNKKPKPNAPVRKKADTARDVGGDTTDTTTTTSTSPDPDMPKKEPGSTGDPSGKVVKEPSTTGTKPPATTKPPVTTTTKPPSETHTKPPKP